MSVTTPRTIPLLSGVSEILDDYDGFVIDLWGVMHDGEEAFPDAVNALQKLRSAGKRIVILSNAPRRSDSVAERNEELGIARDLADAVLSSGEVTWRNLKERTLPFYQKLGEKTFLIGPARDLGMKEGLPYEFVEEIGEAHFILLTGIWDPADTVERYDFLLKPALAKGLPMVCANPDLEVIRGGNRELCAGAVAQHYEKMGGEVQYHGKPHQDIYRECMALLGVSDPSRVLAVGDSLRTDIAGANAAGIHGLFIAGGIHCEDLHGLRSLGDMMRLVTLCDKYKEYPVAAMPVFRW
ncbi:TIGR01459 family HAD-type hydrolase [Kiloniella laminariae]|uniref:TIGR01459 family HAD-type hydrolase n=1 Tax=Kiloniella laminariae TaxID=454162 RepID=UPI0005256A99|nr:TIGR01459 family HAD-type hydrolase [Kiloniella laminariae]